jgi:hypothetical protein
MRLICESMLRGLIIVGIILSYENLGLSQSWLEHMLIVVLEVTGTKGKETKRFLRGRNRDRLLVGWDV